MEEHGENVLHISFDTIIFVLALTALIALIVASNQVGEIGKNNNEHKTTVNMATENGTPNALELTKSDTAYQICQYSSMSGTTLIVDGRTITQAEKDAIIMNNNIANNYLHYNAYTKTTVINHDGSINRVEFKRK